MFNEVLGIKKDASKDIHYREAVRAVIIKNDKILMVKSIKGDFKFPGGGMEKGEKHVDTIKREVEEETGYVIKRVNEKAGIIIERNIDTFKNNSIFEMTSHYYICEVLEEKHEQKLDSYEAELNFLPVWISIEEAISKNEAIMKEKNKNHWVERETIVLKKLIR